MTIASAVPSRSIRAIDSHLHVWSNGEPPFPFADGKDPPASLRHCSRAEDLLDSMATAGVAGALIVQPINHLYDHSYVKHCLTKWPTQFKGMCLANPTLSEESACSELKRLHSDGFCSVRFNPYLWPESSEAGGMANTAGRALYTLAGELSMPVGFMCFKGLKLHYSDIQTLLHTAPHTKAIIDHFGFFRQNSAALRCGRGSITVPTSIYTMNANAEESWQQLLELAQHLQVSSSSRKKSLANVRQAVSAAHNCGLLYFSYAATAVYLQVQAGACSSSVASTMVTACTRGDAVLCVYVKVSGLFRVSAEAYPYKDLHARVSTSSTCHTPEYRAAYLPMHASASLKS
eukprot:12582-Heterococcus_DN1.PRE.2